MPYDLKISDNGKVLDLQFKTLKELGKVVLSLLEGDKTIKPDKVKRVDKTLDVIVNGKIDVPIGKVDVPIGKVEETKKSFKNELPVTILRRDGKIITQTLVSADSVLNPEGNLDVKTIKRRFFGGGSGLLYNYTYFIDGHKVPSFQSLTNLYLHRTTEGKALQDSDRKKISINGFAFPRQQAKVSPNLTWIGHIHVIHDDGRITNSELKCVGQLAKKK